MSPERHRRAALIVLAIASLLQAPLLALLIGGSVAGSDAVWWMFAHLVLGALAGLALSWHLSGRPTRQRWGSVALCTALTLSMPFVGSVGAALALSLGARAARRRRRDQAYWCVTKRPELAYATPPTRSVGIPDTRGFAEQLRFSGDTDALYRKVLSASRLPAALAVDALRAGIAHPDERIRLTAYQTMDRAISRLNDEIDRLTAIARVQQGDACAHAWLQVASNYWELLTLEQGEPVAREHLLGKASAAAQAALVADPTNRNAHFTFGRVALRQGRTELAEAALRRAEGLGMPVSTTRPYRAEAAFQARDFGRVRHCLAGIDRAFTAYPPLRQVAEQWR